jgi:hypothetical protein
VTSRTAPTDLLDASSYVCPIANADSFFPRPHPSASSAAKLGLASLGLGALTGIPAILLSRLVLREIFEGEGLYTGEREAKTGLAFGWVGTLFSLSLVLYWTASSFTVIGFAVVVIGILAVGAAATGKFWSGAPGPLRALGTQPVRSSWPYWTAAAATIVAGSTGLTEKRHTDERLRREAAAICEEETRLANEAVIANRFNDARDHVRAARVVCLGSELIRIAELDADLPGKEAEHRRRLEQEEAERRERLAAEKERRDAVKFEELAGSILERLNAASLKATQRRWLDARDDLARAASELHVFTGSKVESSERWGKLKTRLDELKKQSAPNVEKAEKAREAEEEAKRKREEAMQKAREAAEAAREASRRVRCCDGSLSPSCLCNGSHRGCCSHHGGICGCED